MDDEAISTLVRNEFLQVREDVKAAVLKLIEAHFISLSPQVQETIRKEIARVVAESLPSIRAYAENSATFAARKNAQTIAMLSANVAGINRRMMQLAVEWGRTKLELSRDKSPRLKPEKGARHMPRPKTKKKPRGRPPKR